MFRLLTIAIFRMYMNTINQLFTPAQHLLLLILGLHVSTDHSVIFTSLICYKFQGAVHTFGIPIMFIETKPIH